MLNTLGTSVTSRPASSDKASASTTLKMEAADRRLNTRLGSTTHATERALAVDTASTTAPTAAPTSTLRTSSDRRPATV